MIVFKLSYLRLFLLVLLPSLTAWAYPKVDLSASPDWRLPVKNGGRTPSAKEFTEGYYASLVDLQVHVEKQASYSHIIREIRTTEGVQNGSQINVYFNPAYERLSFHTVTLYRDGRAINKLRAGAFKVAPVEAERDRFIYNDSYVASLLLDDVRPGDRIEYEFTLTGVNPVFAGRFATDFYFASADRLPHRHQVLIVSPSRKLSFRNLNNPPKPHLISKGGLNIYEWDLYDFKSSVQESNQPDWNNPEPHVQVSEYASWQAVTDWALSLYKVPTVSAPLLTFVNDWKRQAGTNKLKYIELAVHFVQNDVRYMGIEIGEYSHRPHDPAQIVRQRYGDCKDKSLLLCTLLQANQIEAYPALTNTYSGSQTNTYLPSPLLFNHAIVWFRLANKSYWIDPTIAHQRNVDGEFSIPLYGNALVISPSTTTLQTITTPRRGTIDITETFVVPSPQKKGGSAKLQVVSVYSDNHADNMRSQLAGSSLATLEKSYHDFYQENYKQHSVELLDSLRIEDNSIANELTSYEGYSIGDGWETDTASGQSTFYVFGRTFYDNFYQLTSEKRHQPLALSFPYEMDYTIKLEMPETWTATDDQWSVKRKGYELSFSRFYNSGDSTISLHYHYKTLADHIAPDEVATYRADVKKITGELEYQLLYNGELASQEGHLHAGSVLFALGLLLGFGYLCRRWYRYSPSVTTSVPAPRPIGGWLVLVSFSVLIAPILQAQQLFTSEIYVDSSTWAALKVAPDLRSILLRIGIYLEGAANLFLFCFAILCAVLFVQRRNSFPFLYTLLLAGRAAFLLVNAVVFGSFFDVALGKDVYNDVVRAIVAAAIWIPYLYKSTRVRQTFVIPLHHISPAKPEALLIRDDEWGSVTTKTDSTEPPASIDQS
ncbi:DUF3857 domain-containing protein [Spirosoma sp. SC4-14]|uniref:DUF3857 domain-containing protein n=1 Tax=Spirosoma sp. SC4-14 TaxID=3128900 RepID=UPI0030CDD1B5